jgi:hypothetical protein
MVRMLLLSDEQIIKERFFLFDFLRFLFKVRIRDCLRDWLTKRNQGLKVAILGFLKGSVCRILPRKEILEVKRLSASTR